MTTSNSTQAKKLYFLIDGNKKFESKFMDELELKQECKDTEIHTGGHFWWVEACPALAELPEAENYRHIVQPPHDDVTCKRYIIANVNKSGVIKVPFTSDFNVLRGFLRCKRCPDSQSHSTDGDYFNVLDWLTEWADDLNKAVSQ